MPGQDDHHRAEIDPLGAPGHVRQELQHVGAHRVVGEVVLDAPDRVVAERLDEIGEPQLLPVHLVIGTHAARILEDDGGADVHDAAQSPATTEISTRNLGWASRASTVARAGVLPESTQASHTSFISLYDAMFAR